MKKLDRYEFIWKAIQKHGYKYDYSKVDYVNVRTKVCIICPIHGEFWQIAGGHLNGQGCWLCSNPVFDTESFIMESQKIHNNKYDYSKVEYKTSHIKVCIICPEHGEFWQTPNSHLNGQGCSKCVKKNVPTTEEWIERAKEIYGDTYDYSKVNYINSKTSVCIICHEKDEDGTEHGEFWQLPNNHLRQHKCPKCVGKNPLTKESFIEKSNLIHNFKYSYNKIEKVKGNKNKVIITCPIHGDFLQRPNDHLMGVGCPLCNESKLERDMCGLLDNNQINYERQKRFSWLGLQSLDFYLPDYNIAIECQGEQHFKPINFFGGEEEFKKILERDKRKKCLCEEHNIKMLYYDKDSNINEILESL